MSTLYPPTLVYPNGGETIVTPTLTISWTPPTVAEVDARPSWFELYYTADYSPDTEPDWIAIATLPTTANNFVWRVPKKLSSDRVRLAIRTRNTKGDRSPFSVSASNLSVNRSSLPIPKIVSPVPNGRYDASVKIIIEPSAVPDRAYYQFYYSSAKAGVPLTSIGKQMPVRNSPFEWVTVNLPAADDYMFYAAIVDRHGNLSEMAEVQNLSIVHEGYFIIDTLPPDGTIKIENGSLFTKELDISVSVYAFDEATGVHAMKVANSQPEKGKQNTTAHIDAQNGIKAITALLEDFGGNRNNDSTQLRRSMLDVMFLKDTEVVDFHVSESAGVTILNIVTKGEKQALYEATRTAGVTSFPRRVREFNKATMTPTAVAAFYGEPYVGIYDQNHVGKLIKNLSTGWTEIANFARPNLVVTDLEVFDNALYLGMSDGSLRKYDGVAVTTISFNGSSLLDPDNLGIPPVKRLVTSVDMLYVVYDNTTVVRTYDGSTLREVVT